MTSQARVLIVDDELEMCAMLESALEAEGLQTSSANGMDGALQLLGQHDFDAVLTDLRMAGGSGLELTRQILRRRPGIPVVVMTAFGDMPTAIEAMRAGAYDFQPKPVELDHLVLVLRRAIEHKRLTGELRLLRTRALPQPRGGIVGRSPAMQRLLALVPKAAQADVPVLITGETGTGKELLARAVHEQSDVMDGPFVAVNCAAIPHELLESELFGHVRGAFTDARTARDGLFVKASQGTLFLDEVGDLPQLLQPKLLRALQERRIRPVGSDREVGVRCRVVAATNRDLQAAAQEGLFRLDLYYRLAVIRLGLPPLSARGGDILLLAQLFLDRAAARTGRGVAGLSTPAARALLAYDWPGNVRELENALERAVAMTEHDRILIEDLPEELRRGLSRPPVIGDDNPADLPTLAALEDRHIRRVLVAVDGNKAQAARVLGIDRRTLYRKLDRGVGQELE